MSAPPVLRPLRAILQRRLQIVPSRPVRTPYYLRALPYRSQLRYDSSIPPDQPPNPEESAQDASSEQISESETTSTTTPLEETLNATAESPEGSSSDIGSDADASVVTNFDISGQEAIIETAIPRLDNLLVKSAFQQLKSADAEIQAGIAEAVARQLAADGATTVAVGDAAVETDEDISGAPVPVISGPKAEDVAEATEDQPESAVSQEMEFASLPSEGKIVASAKELAEPIATGPAPPEPAVEAAKSTEPEHQEETVSEVVVAEEAVSEEPIQQAVVTETRATDNTAPQQPAIPGLEALKHASPEQIAAMMAYFQTLQAPKPSATRTETVLPEAPLEQQKVPESVTPETTTPESSSAEAVAKMTESAEPAQLEPEAPQAAPETPGLDPTLAEDVIAKPVKAESEFIVEAIPDVLSSKEEEPAVATTQEFEGLDNKLEATDAEPELPYVPEPLKSADAAVKDPPETNGTLESAAAAERAEIGQEQALSVDKTLDSVLEEELEKLTEEEHAKELAAKAREQARKEVEAIKKEVWGEGGANRPLEPSRLPRNVATYYLQPLRRVAEYGVPACDLQLRSYSVRPLESFCDFALRAAYYLGLPAHGPVPLPRIIERWTVPRASFIFKKSQENFERITRRRMIQIKDANPETVQIWLAFLQKHQQAAVGMKANLWEFSSIDVAKQMDKALEEAQPLMDDKYRLLHQNKEFETVEKVDEFLQAMRYKKTGDQVERNQ